MSVLSHNNIPLLRFNEEESTLTWRGKCVTIDEYALQELERSPMSFLMHSTAGQDLMEAATRESVKYSIGGTFGSRNRISIWHTRLSGVFYIEPASDATLECILRRVEEVSDALREALHQIDCVIQKPWPRG